HPGAVLRRRREGPRPRGARPRDPPRLGHDREVPDLLTWDRAPIRKKGPPELTRGSAIMLLFGETERTASPKPCPCTPSTSTRPCTKTCSCGAARRRPSAWETSPASTRLGS